MKLLGFVVDLARDPQLRQAYNQNPDEVAKKFGLTREQQEALLVTAPHKLLRLIRQEIAALIPFLLGPCPADSNFSISQVTPAECLQGSTVQVDIVADQLAPQPNPQPPQPPPPNVPGFIKCWLRHEVTGEIIPGQRVSGPDGLPGQPRRGRVNFLVPADATPGQYELWIWALTIAVSRPGAFTVQERAPLVAGPPAESHVHH